MRIHELTCFGAAPGAGNPALVIEDGPAGQEARAAFARERATTCVFIDAPAEPGVAATLDYQYPHTRSPLCLHATLAAARVLLADQPLTVATAMQGQRLLLSRDGDGYFVRLDAQAAPQPALPDLATLLRTPGFTPASSARVASVGSPKLLVEVADEAVLHALQPDLAAITAWGKANGVNGIYAWCRRADGRYEGRNFNHLDPLLEDSATGVAAGALTTLLGHGIELLQGRATGRDCLIRTRLEGHAVLVGGAAEPA
ncbi:PhzF family phenazine biosynthesis protein [Massilia solisilvae]|uniref:PhzF family phenazine biosynthesis protein n=1 Tax=Massilia solisilvae TaxID=1811225 RepID=A0ABT2BFC7_9BURK|nr:PhzF family phenazine biosynthesis protein [Massilia solisilvae]MCS0607117.1 PhzF family phenazine biosynthesis protein [Massilia solisilvae]